MSSFGPPASRPDLWPTPPVPVDVLLDCRNRDCPTFGWERTVTRQLTDVGVVGVLGARCAYCDHDLWTVNDEEYPRP